MSDIKDIANDEATRAAAIEAANNPTRETSIALLSAAVTALFGPFAGLAIRLGANVALDAVAKHKGKKVGELSTAEIRLTAAELLSEKTFEEQAEQARKQAAADLESGNNDDEDDGS